MSSTFQRMFGAVLVALALAAGSTSVASAAPPTIWGQWVSDVTPNDATLHAEINPGGLQTQYMLQIDTTGNFKFDQNDGCLLHPPGIFCTQALVPGDPLPPGLVPPQEQTLPASHETQHVSVNMASIGATLQPETTYHYRAVAANGLPFVYGWEQTFTTPPLPPPTGPPAIENQWVTSVTSSDATLHAEIDPGGLLTKYKLQLDTTGNFSFYQSSSCLLAIPGIACLQVVLPGDPLPEGLVQPPEFSLPAGYGSQHVSVNMASIGATLQPETTYHYRAVAGNSDGIVYGAYPYFGDGAEEVTFTTPAASTEPPTEEPPEEGPPAGEPPQEDPPTEEPPEEELPGEEPPGEEPPVEEPPTEEQPPAGVPPPWGEAAGPVLPPQAAPRCRARHRSKRATRRRAVRRCVRKARRRARHRGHRTGRRAARRRCAHRYASGSSRRAGVNVRVALGP